MKFEKFEKIKRPDNADFLLNPEATVMVTEKLDGSNTSIYYDDEKGFTATKHSAPLKDDKDLNSFRPFADKNIIPLLKTVTIDGITYDPKNMRFYGEWMSTGHIKYPDELHHWYGFLIVNNDEQVAQDIAFKILDELGLEHAPVFTTGVYKDIDLKDYIGKTLTSAEHGEGVVVTAIDGELKKRAGDGGEKFYSIYPKQKFVDTNYQENLRHIKVNKDFDGSQRFAVQFATQQRVNKQIQKQLEEGNLQESDLKLENMKNLIRLIPTLVADDILEEEKTPEDFVEKTFRAQVGRVSGSLIRNYINQFRDEKYL